MTELNRTCILLSEEDVLVRNLLSALLHSDGYLILAAANAHEAEELCRAYAKDIRLALSKERVLSQELTATCPGVHVILISEPTYQQLKQMAQSIEPAAFRLRATLPPKLKSHIEWALQHPGARQATAEI